MAGGLLASRYPIGPVGAVAALLLWSGVNFRWPLAWLVALPALLPISGFATWTGWFAFEELDLLVLGAAAGGYARIALLPPSRLPHNSRVSASGTAVLLIIAFALSSAVALYRGIVDAGSFDFDWYGSYDSAMNSVRLFKSFAWALLLWPLLRHALRVDDKRAAQLLSVGLALGLGGASLVALWERAAFTGILNFSTDYRTTALFWEMHVGGAAFDGFLALTVPFAMWELRRRSGAISLGLALGVAVLAIYACLTTFSRDVYLAVPAGLAVLAILLAAQRRAVRSGAETIPVWRVAILAVVAAAAFFLVFREGGYRALAAFLATSVVGLMLDATPRPATTARWAIAVGAGFAAGALGALVGTIVPRGSYLVFTVAFACNVGLLVWRFEPTSSRGIVTRWAAFIALAVASAAMAWHWGGVGAFADSSGSLLVLVAFILASSRRWKPWLAEHSSSRPIWFAGAAVLAAAVAVFSGGDYMGDRFSAVSGDLEGRLQHWKDGIRPLEGATDWLLGKGLGRFPANYLFHAPDRSFPGSYYLHRGGEETFVSLAGPRYATSWGDAFRLAQRVPPLPGSYGVTFELRAREDVQLHVEVCEQHLLYNGACAISTIEVSASPSWQKVSRVLNGEQLSRGSWYAPRLAFFAFAVATSGRSIDVRSVSLMGPDGHDLIANGNFVDGMARWIPISERLHLPWHIKNLALSLIFDQGLAGLAAFTLLMALTFWRLAFGQARDHPAAPYLAASLAGFLVIGMFDSLLDVPRVAFVFYLLVLTSLVLPRESISAHGAPAGTSDGRSP